jgi:dipeptidase E
MKLFLSGGSGEPFNLDKKFMETIDKTKPLLYIPIAIDTKSHPYPECLKWIKRYFSGFKFTNIKMVTDLRKVSKKDLDKYGSIYIGGGNTPYLLKELKESGFYEYLKIIMNKDISIAGGSAGAIIFAKTIIPSLSCDENSVRLTNFDSFDKLNGYDLWAHYDPLMDKEIREYMKKYSLKKIIALPEKCGIYVDDDNKKIIGEFSAWVFDSKGKKELKNGDILI